jgi:hypothetical protein
MIFAGYDHDQTICMSCVLRQMQKSRSPMLELFCVKLYKVKEGKCDRCKQPLDCTNTQDAVNEIEDLFQ